MMEQDLLQKIALGEDSVRQFKEDVKNGESLASEIVAFANAGGGEILIGVSDGGDPVGLKKEDVSRINQLISNTASQLIRSPVAVRTKNIMLENDRIIIILTVPDGLDKPYFDKNGVIWVKCGSDKRRINSKEELRQLFQKMDVFHADELPTKATFDQLDKLRFQDFLIKVYGKEWPSSSVELSILLQNMNLATEDEVLNLAGVLLFAKNPDWIKPQFVVKTVCYFGVIIPAQEYQDMEECTGSFSKIFEDALAFVMRNLHKVQRGPSVNSVGVPEIPQIVFEELLVNALVHRDYFISAPIRVFVFEDRIEIISPGHLPNHLTVDKIKAGNSNIRNPILASYVAKGILPYKGLGSGITRALSQWSDIEFTDDRTGCLFIATIRRKKLSELVSQKGE